MKLALFMKTAIKSLLEGPSRSSEGRIWKDTAEDCPPLCVRQIHRVHTRAQEVHRPPFSFSPHTFTCHSYQEHPSLHINNNTGGLNLFYIPSLHNLMLFTQRNSSNQRNSCFRDHNTTGRKVNPKIFCLFTLFLHCREVCLSALLSQPSPCPDTSHKEANIGSHLVFHCSVTANSSLLHFLLSYPPHVYPISFIIF